MATSKAKPKKPAKPKPGKVGMTAKKTTGTIKKKTPSYKDAEYLAQVNALKKALGSYTSKVNAQKTRLGTDYGISVRDLGQQRTRDLSDIENDFAARGIVRSGVYGQRVGDYNTEYNEQLSNLARNRDRALTDIDTGMRDYNDEYNSLLEQARLSAIRRRTASLKK